MDLPIGPAKDPRPVEQPSALRGPQAVGEIAAPSPLEGLLRRDGRAMLSVFATNLLLAVGGLLSGFLLARSLKPDGRGLLGSIQALPTVVASFVMLGMQESLVFLGINHPERRRAYLKLSMGMSTVVALIVTGGLLLVPGGIVHRTWAHVAYLGFIVVTPLMYLPHQLLQASRRFGLWSALKAMTSLTWILIAVFVALVPSTRSGSFVAVAYLCALAGTIPIFVVVGLRSAPRGPAPTLHDARMLLRYGIPVMLTAAPMAVNLRLDLVVVAGRFDLTHAGYYVAALAWAGLLIPIFGTFTTVAMPLIARRRVDHGTDDGKLFLTFTAAIVAIVFAVTIPVTRLIFPIVFGDRFRPATNLAALALAVGAIQGAKDVAAATLRGRGQVRAPLAAETIALVVTLTTLWPMLIRFGLPGGQWSSAIAYSVSWIVLTWFVAHPLRGLAVSKSCV